MSTVKATDSCCMSKEELDAADAARFGLPDPRELVDDPVLAGCCAEDLASMRKSEAVRKALEAADRSIVRLNLHGQALHVLPQQPDHQQEDESSIGSDTEDNDGDDVALAVLRQRRLQELQRQAAERRQRSGVGYGTLLDIAPGALLDRVEQVDGPVVAHLAVAGCETCSQLDEHLAVLAHRMPYTLFLRVAIGRGNPLATRLKMMELPGLVCFRSGGVVGRAPVSQFGPPGCLVDEEVTAYLRRLHVLRGEEAAGSSWGAGGGRGGAGGGGGGRGGSGDGDGEEEEAEWRVQPCEVCGRRYPHEHVRAVYGSSWGQGGRGGGGEDEDEGDD